MTPFAFDIRLLGVSHVSAKRSPAAANTMPMCQRRFPSPPGPWRRQECRVEKPCVTILGASTAADGLAHSDGDQSMRWPVYLSPLSRSLLQSVGARSLG